MNKNLFRYLLLLHAFLFVSVTYAQNNQFLWVSSGSGSNGVVNSCAYSAIDNSVVSGGYMTNNGNSSFNISISGSKGQNGILSKFNNAGSNQWGFSVGGNGVDEITAVAVDGLGNIIVGGTFEGAAAEFQGTSGGLVTLNSNGGKDIFIAKYNSTGVLQWLRQGSSTSDDFIHDITVDASNNIYVAGSGPGTFSYYGNGISNFGSTEGFALKILSDGSFAWLNSVGSSGADEYRSVTVFGGVAYFGGHFKGLTASLFGTGLSGVNLFVGTSDIVIAKYNATTGASLDIATFGGSNNDILRTLTNDGTSLYFAASSVGGLGLGSTNYNNTYQEIVTAKLNTSFAVQWAHSTTHSTAGDANAGGIGFMPNGRVVLTGDYTGTINTGLASPLTSSSRDGIIFFLNSTTGASSEHSRFYGIAADVGASVSVKSNTEIFLGGSYIDNCLFPPINITGNNTTSHPFVGKFGCSTASTATLSGSTTICSGQSASLQVTFTGISPYNITITDGTTPVNITGITTSTYAHVVSPATTSVYTISAFSSGSCLNTSSGSATVTVLPAIANNIISSDVTICSGEQASFTGLVPAGGDGSTPTYLWEYKTSVSWFSGLNTNNLQNYTSVPISQNVQYRRKVTINGCPTHISNVLTATVTPVITNNIISGSQSSCGSFDPAIFSSSLPNGGNGTYTYSWQESSDSLFSNPASVGSSQDYDPPFQTSTKYYRRIVVSGGCNSISNFLTIYIEPVLGNNSISSNQTFCASGTPSPLVGSVPTGGSGTYVYSWESSPNGTSSWTNVGAAQNYSPGVISSTTYFRRLVTSGTCTIANISNTVVITIEPALANNTISSNQTFCSSGTPSALVGSVPTGGSGTFVYLWQSSPTGVTWTNVGTSQNYSPGLISSTTHFRRLVTSGTCTAANISNTVIITIEPALANNSISSNQTFCASGTPSTLVGSLPTGGSGTYVYTWESSPNGTSSWTSVGAAQNYSPSVISSTTYFRRLVTSGTCTTAIISNTVIITIEPALANNTISSNQTFCSSGTPNSLVGTLPTGGSGTYTYAWQSSPNGTTWTSVGTSQNYSPGLISSTTQFRRLVTSGTCTAANISNTVIITIEPALANNSISSNQTFCASGTPSTLVGSLPTGGSGTYVYAWESSPNGTTWTNVGAAQNYSPGIISSTTYYRRLVTSGTCTVANISNTVIITIQPALANNSISSNQTFCSSGTPNPLVGSLPTGGSGTYAYTWQSSPNGTTWTNVGTSQNYSPGTLSSTTQYRRLVTSGTCNTAIQSNVITITIDVPVTSNSIASSQFICSGSTPNMLTGSVPSGGDGSNYLFLWYESQDSVQWAAATGVNDGLDYSPASLASSHYYFRRVTSGACPTDTSNALAIIVYQAITDNVISGDTAVCNNTNSLLISGTTGQDGSGAYNYLWESSTNGTTFLPAQGANNLLNYTTGNLTQNTYFRRKIIDANCTYDTSVSNLVVITVYSPLFGNFLITKDTICLGEFYNANFVLSGDAPFDLHFFVDGVSQYEYGITGTNFIYSDNPSASGSIMWDSIFDSHGCIVTEVDIFEFRVVPYPVVILQADTTVCDSYIFNPSNGNGDLSFFSPTLGFLSIAFPLDYETKTFGAHDFILTETVEGCASSDTMEVTFTKPVGLITAGPDKEYTKVEYIVLEASQLLSNETGIWTLISGAGIFADSSQPNTQFSELLSGQTILEWTVDNGYCPTKSDQVIIYIYNLIVPTGFSPNNDGVNDNLEFFGRDDITTIHLQVFDRWGTLVFEDNNYQNDWNGTNKSGEPLPEDTYFMIVDLGEKGFRKSYLIIRR